MMTAPNHQRRSFRTMSNQYKIVLTWQKNQLRGKTKTRKSNQYLGSQFNKTKSCNCLPIKYIVFVVFVSRNWRLTLFLFHRLTVVLSLIVGHCLPFLVDCCVCWLCLVLHSGSACWFVYPCTLLNLCVIVISQLIVRLIEFLFISSVNLLIVDLGYTLLLPVKRIFV